MQMSNLPPSFLVRVDLRFANGFWFLDGTDETPSQDVVCQSTLDWLHVPPVLPDVREAEPVCSPEAYAELND